METKAMFVFLLLVNVVIGDNHTGCLSLTQGAALLSIARSNQENIQNLTKSVNQLLLQGYHPSPLLHSCEEIKTNWPHSPSDYYIIADNHGHTRHVYCHMENICGSGGWMRIAYLNTSDSAEECPPGFKLYQSGGVRACGRQTSSSGSCQSVKFPSYSISYSQVCGRIMGYQYRSPDAINADFGTGHHDINSDYVDGVSLTHGSPRQHVWTFMAGTFENKQRSTANCPCAHGTTQTVQSFIGTDYFCESGNPDTYWQSKLYIADPLWDKKGCSTIEQLCCHARGLPWFHKTIQFPTNDYIEMRVCGDQSTWDEDVPVSYYEIYVK